MKPIIREVDVYVVNGEGDRGRSIENATNLIKYQIQAGVRTHDGRRFQ
jgi:hypothetical protein